MGEKLTGHGGDALGEARLVGAGEGAQGLVAHGEEDDGEEGDDEGGGGADVPLAEDDAEVGRVPGEEHLRVGYQAPLATLWSFWSMGKAGLPRTLMLHMSSMPPWPPPPWSIPAWFMCEWSMCAWSMAKSMDAGGAASRQTPSLTWTGLVSSSSRA